jgi:hypothetical protein
VAIDHAFAKQIDADTVPLRDQHRPRLERLSLRATGDIARRGAPRSGLPERHGLDDALEALVGRKTKQHRTIDSHQRILSREARQLERFGDAFRVELLVRTVQELRRSNG